MVPVISETALQSTTQLREMREPPTVGCQLVAILESVPEGEPLQRQIRQGGRRLTDGETRMGAALEQYDIVAKHRQHASQERSRESAADDGDFARCLHSPPHTVQAIRGSTRPVRFIR